MTPIDEQQARVIRTWRVDLGCSWRRVAALYASVWGGATDQERGAFLCETAANMLGEAPGEDPWN